LPQIKAGKLRPLGVTTIEPLPFLPDVPTIDSSLKGYEASAWIGFGVPKGTPPEIIATLNKQTNAAVLDPNIQQRFADLGVVAVPPNSPGEFTKFITENIEKWTKGIKFANIKPERRAGNSNNLLDVRFRQTGHWSRHGPTAAFDQCMDPARASTDAHPQLGIERASEIN